MKPYCRNNYANKKEIGKAPFYHVSMLALTAVI